MTTTDSSFIATGVPTGVGRRIGTGFYANAKSSLPSAVSRPFTFGTLGGRPFGGRLRRDR
jgi:hypothetical protein